MAKTCQKLPMSAFLPFLGFRNEFLRFTSENKVDLDELYILKITFKNSLESVWGMSHSISHRISSRISHKISYSISHKIFPQDFPARISHKNFPQEFPTRLSHKNFPQDFPTRIFCKIFLQDFPKLNPDWLAPHHPIPNAKFPPITALLNGPTYHKSAKVSPPPFLKSYGNPKSMNKLTLNEPAITTEKK